MRFDTYVEDAVLWIQQLQVDSRFSSITVIGHSEGSLIGMLATQKTEADAFVSIADLPKLHHKFYEINCNLDCQMHCGNRMSRFLPL